MNGTRTDALVERLLDDECFLRNEYIKEKAWDALVIADYINPMYCEWIAEAAERFSCALSGLAFEYRGKASEVAVECGRDAIQMFFSDSSHCYSMLTTLDEDFLVFKDDGNRFFIVAGSEEFVKSAFRCNKDTAKKFFEWSIDSLDDRDELMAIWMKYVGG